MAKRIGRPSKYSKAMTDRICDRIANGESLHTICKDDGYPHRITVLRWLAKYPEFRNQYARAREDQSDFYADEIIAIADDGSRDYIKDEDGNDVVDHDHIQRSKLRVDARKWYASKVAPKKYGDTTKHEVSGPDGRAIQTESKIDLTGVPTETLRGLLVNDDDADKDE